MNKESKQSTKQNPIEIKEANTLAVVRIRGRNSIHTDIADTLSHLNLDRKYSCILTTKNPITIGMLQKAKDWVAFGEPMKDVFDLIQKKMNGKKAARLNPPKGGFKGKGTKYPYAKHGVAGYQGEKINELLKKMI